MKKSFIKRLFASASIALTVVNLSELVYTKYKESKGDYAESFPEIKDELTAVIEAVRNDAKENGK